MVLGYAVTAHKSQGDTLVEVIIDFTPDESGKKPYICKGSFYVALTHVQQSENVFLKDFDKSHIKVNTQIPEKMEAMRKFRKYNFMKIYNGEEIFQEGKNEVKIGYININGLNDGYHAEYLNNDKNLLNLDLFLLAKTKLLKHEKDEELQNLLSQYDIMHRFDANDGKKHMGLLYAITKEVQFLSTCKY